MGPVKESEGGKDNPCGGAWVLTEEGKTGSWGLARTGRAVQLHAGLTCHTETEHHTKEVGAHGCSGRRVLSQLSALTTDLRELRGLLLWTVRFAWRVTGPTTAETPLPQVPADLA